MAPRYSGAHRSRPVARQPVVCERVVDDLPHSELTRDLAVHSDIRADRTPPRLTRGRRLPSEWWGNPAQRAPNALRTNDRIRFTAAMITGRVAQSSGA